MSQTTNQTETNPGAGNYREILKRFYLQMGFAVAAAVLGVVDSLSYQMDWNTDSRLVFVASMGFFITLGCRLFAEKRDWREIRYLALSAAAFALLAILALAVGPAHGDPRESRIFALGVAIILLSLTAPFIGLKHDDIQFWRHCLVTLRSAAIGIAVTLVITIGLVFVVAGLDEFSPTGRTRSLIRSIVHPALIFFIFFPAYFLSVFPSKTIEARHSTAPNWLVYAIDYVVAPIMISFGLTALVLLAALPFIWDQIADKSRIPASIYGIGCIAAWFAAMPVREKGNAATRLFCRGFPTLLLLLAILTAVAVLPGIANDGVSERRYMQMLLAVWFGGVALYHLLPTRRRLIAAPLSLAILLILSTTGPWSATSVTTRSKLALLEDILTENGMLAAGKIVPASDNLDPETAKRISGILDYFYELRKLSTINEWLAEHGVDGSANGSKAILSQINIPYVEQRSSLPGFSQMSYPRAVIPAGNFQYLLEISETSIQLEPSSETELDTTRVYGRYGNGESPKAVLDFHERTITVIGNNNETVRFELTPIIREINRDAQGDRDYTLSHIALEAQSQSGQLHASLFITRIDGEIWRDDISLERFEALLLITDRTAPQ